MIIDPLKKIMKRVQNMVLMQYFASILVDTLMIYKNNID
jgi:hypothetical protein